MAEKTWIEISQQNIIHNIKSLKSLLAPETKFMAVLKSNAYGHGIGRMNTVCVQSGLVDFFGVDSLDEALLLRKLGNTKPILVLGYVPFERVEECVENNVSIAAYNIELLNYLERDSRLPPSRKASEGHGRGNDRKKGRGKELKIHIKVETGTSRQGIADEELIEFVKKASQNPNILIEGIYTHFANIEDTTNPSYAMEQLKRFNESTKMLDKYFDGIAASSRSSGTPRNDNKRWSNGVIKHSACSAALINYPETHFDMARAGISLYGLWSSNETKLVAKNKSVGTGFKPVPTLKPALTWKTKIAQIKNLAEGAPVSYGLTETVKRDSRIAILPIGYWDGYDRKLSNIGEVLIRGKRAKVLGRVCMNMTIVDITDIPEAKLFDEVMLLDDEITAEELAKKIGTINYEVITRINPLIKRMIV